MVKKDGMILEKQHSRAVTSLALLERARAWEWVKDPPAGEGQVGQKTPLWQRRDGVDRKAPSLAKEGRGGSKKHLFGKEVPFASEARKGGVSGWIEILPRNNTFVFRQKNKSEASFTRNLA